MLKKFLGRVLIFSLAILCVALNTIRIESGKPEYVEVYTQDFSVVDKNMFGIYDVEVKYQYDGKNYHGIIENVPTYVWNKNIRTAVPVSNDPLAGVAAELKMYVNPDNLSQVYMVEYYTIFDIVFQAWVIGLLFAAFDFVVNTRIDKKQKKIAKSTD